MNHLSANGIRCFQRKDGQNVKKEEAKNGTPRGGFLALGSLNSHFREEEKMPSFRQSKKVILTCEISLPVKITGFELRRIALSLVRPMRTSFGTLADRDVLLVRAMTENGTEGWGECVAFSAPFYSPEYVQGCAEVIERFFAPAILARKETEAEEVSGLLEGLLGHQMAKATIETAVLDAQLKEKGQSFASYFSASREEVDCGVSVGIANSIDLLLEEVSSYVEEGYRRVKLKIEPGWDVEPVSAVRSAWPEIPLQVDANQAYSLSDAEHLAGLDRFHLLLIEQPLNEHDLLGHADLAKKVQTPICLDERITSVADARQAIALGATKIINIKPGRVGGYLESVRIHDFCKDSGIPVWCGGMFETGIGRAANVALAALPGFTMPGDTSGSSRYFHRDITSPFVLENGRLKVPQGPGIGVSIDRPYLEEITTDIRRIGNV